MTSNQVANVLKIADSDGCRMTTAPNIHMYNSQAVPLECVQKCVAQTEFRAHRYTPVLEKAGQAVPASGSAPSEKIEPVKVVTQTEKIASGWSCEVQPVISPDRHSVRLKLEIEHYVYDETRSSKLTLRAGNRFDLKDGQTLVWDFGESTAQRHLFVLVTPHIHVRQEPEERIIMGELTPIPGR
jgi:hypothetical protein